MTVDGFPNSLFYGGKSELIHLGSESTDKHYQDAKTPLDVQVLTMYVYIFTKKRIFFRLVSAN